MKKVVQLSEKRQGLASLRPSDNYNDRHVSNCGYITKQHAHQDSHDRGSKSCRRGRFRRSARYLPRPRFIIVIYYQFRVVERKILMTYNLFYI
jgi:hypothetical protein